MSYFEQVTKLPDENKFKLLEFVNKKIDYLYKVCKKEKQILFNIDTKLKSTNINSLKIFCNVLSILIIENMIKDIIKSNNYFLQNVATIERYISFGDTDFPLFKVFGKSEIEQSTTFEFLGHGHDFLEAKKFKLIRNLKSENVILATRVFPVNGYYVFRLHILSDFEKGNPEYTEVRTGTKDGDYIFSFIFEGRRKIDLEEMLKKQKGK